jgi:hypothetical protein
MSQTAEVTSVVTPTTSVGKGADDHSSVLIVCAIGLVLSLVALLLSPEWVFQAEGALPLHLP